MKKREQHNCRKHGTYFGKQGTCLTCATIRGWNSRTAQAVKLLKEYDGLSARQFAKLFWPNSAGWSRVKNQGRGATHGKGMWLAAGAFLSKLERQGLVGRKGEYLNRFYAK